MDVSMLSFIDGSGAPMSALNVTKYDGRTIVKRNGEKKVMRFSSGKLGYFAGGKVVLDGVTYQVSCSVVALSGTTASPVRQFTAEQIAQMNAQAAAGTDGDNEHDEQHS